VKPIVPLLLLLTASAAGVSASGAEEDGEELRVEGETVEVVGERVEADPMETSAAVTTLVVDEQVRASAELADVVGTAAGVHLQRLGGLGAYSVVSIRGSSARQVEVFVDGVPLNPHGSAPVNLAELPLDAFERIEVYRSGAPLHLGSAAMGGVVNLVTAPGSAPPPRLEIAAGSYWARRLSASGGFATAAGTRRVPLDLLLDFETTGSQGAFDYFDDRGTTYNLMDDRTRTRLNNDHVDGKGRVRLRAGTRDLMFVAQQTLLAREQGVPGIGQDPAEYARLGVLDNTVLGELSGRPRTNVRLRGRISWRARQERYRDPQAELGTGQQDSRDQHHTVAARITVGWLPVLWQSLQASAELRLDGYRPEDLLRGDPTDGIRNRVSAVFGVGDELSLAADHVRISPALQLHLLDNHLLGDVPFSESPVAPEGQQRYAVLAPRLGLLVRPVDAIALKGNIGRAFRPPDFTELFGDHGVVIGNSDLVPETAVTWDAGIQLDLPPNRVVDASFSTSYFWRETQDAIVYVQNAQKTQLPINLGRARVSGIEAGADVNVADVLKLRGNVTWMDSISLDGREAYAGNQLPRLPRWEVWVEAAVAWQSFVRLGYDLSHTAGNYWDATNWYLAAPRTLHGISLRVQPGEGWPFVEIDLRNLLDSTVESVPRDPLNPGDGVLVVQPLTDFSGYPLPGRTVMVTVGWRGAPSPTQEERDASRR